jgi:hypothetical protein
MSARRWRHTPRIRWNGDGPVTLTFQVDGLEEMVWWVLGWAVEVIRPEQPRASVVDKLRRGLSLNQATVVDQTSG